MIPRLVLVLAAAILGAACDSSPTGPSDYYYDDDDEDDANFDTQDTNEDGGGRICDVTVVDTGTSKEDYGHLFYPLWNIKFACAPGSGGATIMISTRVWVGGRIRGEGRGEGLYMAGQTDWLCGPNPEGCYFWLARQGEGSGSELYLDPGTSFQWAYRYRTCVYNTHCELPDPPATPQG